MICEKCGKRCETYVPMDDEPSICGPCCRKSSSPQSTCSVVLTVEIGEDGKCTDKGKSDIAEFLEKYLPQNDQVEFQEGSAAE